MFAHGFGASQSSESEQHTEAASGCVSYHTMARPARLGRDVAVGSSLMRGTREGILRLEEVTRWDRRESKGIQMGQASR